MQEIKDWLEVIYFLSGPSIAVIAYLALSQIKVAKEQIAEQKKTLRISSTRDALKLTADQVTLYCEKIIPLQNILYEKLKAEDITILDKFKIEFVAGSIKMTPPKEELSAKDFQSFIEELINVANAMECFSTYFSTGVADEKIAYLSLGSTFCFSMKNIYPILFPLSNEGRRFSAILRLYAIWGARLENENLEKQKLVIESKLKSKKQVTVPVVGAES